MASTNWTGQAGDDAFGTPGNWDNGQPSGSVDTSIAGTQAAPLTVNIDTGLAYTARSLTTTHTTLALGAGTLTIDRASSLDALTETGGELVVNATDTSAAVTSLSGPADFSIFSTLDVAHGTLALSGTDTLAGRVTGDGTLRTEGTAQVADLQLADGVTLDNTGTETLGDGLGSGLNGDVLDNEAGAIFDLTSAASDQIVFDTGIDNAGLFERTGQTTTSFVYADTTNTGIVASYGGEIDFTRTFSNSGTITGTGTIGFTHLTTFLAGTSLTVARMTFDSPATMSLGEDLAYGGSLYMTQGSVIALDGHTFTFGGGTGDSFSTLATGGGTLLMTGKAAVDNLVVDNGTELDNRGTLSVDADYLWLGDGHPGTASLFNEAGATFDLMDGGGITYFGSAGPGHAAISNAGLFETTGWAGVSDIAFSFDNTGTVWVESGTLDFTGTLSGDGRLDVNAGAELRLGTATAETVVLFGRGARLAIDAHASYTGIIQGLAAGDVIRLGDVAATSVVSAKIDGSSLDIVLNDANTISYALSAPMPDVIVAHGADAAGGTDFTLEEAPCFLTGTRIRTTRGEIAVEHLRAGDHVLTADGRAAPVRWVGCRRFDLTTIRNASHFRPIRIRRDAIAPGIPKRDLLVSRGHAICLDGVLVPALYLANGASVVEDRSFNAVTYWHVELDRHDVLIAEGLTAESYLDTGNRHLFETGHSLAERVADAGSCLPVVKGGEALAHIRAGIAARIELGRTPEPDLHLLADGVAVPQGRRAGGAYRFVVGTAPGRLHLVSRANIAPRIGIVPDMRMFGVAVTAIVLRAPGIARALDLTEPALAGFSWPECGADGTPFRWTDGDAVLPPALWAGVGAFMLDVSVSATVPYWTAPEALAMAG